MRVLGAFFGSMELTSITTAAIESWMGGRLDAGVSRATLNRNRAALSVLFEWAIREKHHPGPNPARAIKVFRESPGRTRYLTAEESSRLMLAAAPHLKVVIALGLHTGGRLGEILALRWQDVDLEGRVITYGRETTKSGKTRHVPVTAALAGILSGVRRGRPDQHVCVWNEAGLRSVKSAFTTARRKAGLGPDVTAYTLRHTFASHAVMNGLDLVRLRSLMGHSDFKLTQRYAHLSREYLQDAVRFLGPPGRRETDEA